MVKSDNRDITDKDHLQLSKHKRYN